MIDRVRGALDSALDLTVVPGLSAVGFHARSRLWRWPGAGSYDMTGRTVVVTGATSGMGLAAAVRFASIDAQVVVCGRDRERLDRALEQVRAVAAPGAVIRGELADLADTGEVRALGGRLAAAGVDVLVNNAAVLSPERAENADGVEVTAAVMLLAPFVLVRSLPGLQRIVTVVSAGMYAHRLDVDALDPGPGDWHGAAVYARAKRAQLALTHQWAARGSALAHAADPGWADTPGLAAGLPRFGRVMRPILRTAEQGADTTCWLAAAPEVAAAPNGSLWRDRRRRSEHWLPITHADPGQEQQLWAWCEERAG